MDVVGQRFWELSQHVIGQRARWYEEDHSFLLKEPPEESISAGHYYLISKNKRFSEKTESDEHGRFLYRLSHPLGEWVIESGKNLNTPLCEVVFDVTQHPTRVVMVEALKGQSGLLRLSRLSIQSYEQEEYLLFSAFNDKGESIDQETCEKLFNCGGRVNVAAEVDEASLERLKKESKRHAEATISRSLEANSEHFNQARERLDRWAEDSVLAAEQAIKDTKEQIKALNRQCRQAETLTEQKELQLKIQSLEKKKRRQRQQIFDVEDEINNKRDALIVKLESRLSQKTEHRELFTIYWKVI